MKFTLTNTIKLKHDTHTIHIEHKEITAAHKAYDRGYVATYDLEGNQIETQQGLAYGICTHNNTLHTSSWNLNCIFKHNDSFGHDVLKKPAQIASHNNTLYVANTQKHTIELFQNNKHTHTIPNINTPFAIHVDDTHILATNMELHALTVIDTHTHETLHQIRNLYGPMGVCANKLHIFVADTYNNAINVYNKKTYALEHTHNISLPKGITHHNNKLYTTTTNATPLDKSTHIHIYNITSKKFLLNRLLLT